MPEKKPANDEIRALAAEQFRGDVFGQDRLIDECIGGKIEVIRQR